jgi:hypothetical protein
MRSGSWTLTFTEIVHGERDGYVVFDAVQYADTDTEDSPA